MKYEDCLDIVAHCSSKGIATQLNTNASLLSPERIEKLRDAGLSNIHISFNFTDADKYATYYHVHPRMYEKIVQNIRLCTEAKLETVLETLLFAETQNNMPAISEKVYELGVRIHEIQNSIVMDHTNWNAISTKEALVRSVHDLIAHKKMILCCISPVWTVLQKRWASRNSLVFIFPTVLMVKNSSIFTGTGTS